jgi:hypothetical protein
VGEVRKKDSWISEEGSNFLVDVAKEVFFKSDIDSSDSDEEVEGFSCGGGAREEENEFRYLDNIVLVLEFLGKRLVFDLQKASLFNSRAWQENGYNIPSHGQMP